MSSTFTPCPGCSRHVKRGDRMCPFCGGEVPHAIAPVVQATEPRLSGSTRLVAAAAGLALTAAVECSINPEPLPPYGLSLPFPVDGSSSTPIDVGTPIRLSTDGAPDASVPTVDGAEMPPADGDSSASDGEEM